MSVKISGPVRMGFPRRGGFYFLCLSLLYGVIVLLRAVAQLLGYRQQGELSKENEHLVLEQTTMFLGVPLTRLTRVFQSQSICAVSHGTDQDPGLLLVGIAFLFYASLWGVYLMITGFQVAEPSRIFWGMGSIVVGLIIDALLFSLHYYLHRRRGAGITLTFAGGQELTVFTGSKQPPAEVVQELASVIK
ncbi:hypothetical protein KKF84_20370 [Myxococcota bacterium]|nr:hypothetical protein [Myxococcota bacterium]MBU1537682.1 hypothetical protein [Myxococcota bacterium]